MKASELVSCMQDILDNFGDIDICQIPEKVVVKEKINTTNIQMVGQWVSRHKLLCPRCGTLICIDEVSSNESE